MLRPRLIPCLLVSNQGLVKTTQFSDPKYVGDPINAVRIFNEKLVDELMVLDIDATVQNRAPDTKMIGHLADESRMPLCYGGGIKTLDQIETIIGLGVEKVALSASALADPDLITQAAKRVGAQSIVVVLDIKRIGLRKRTRIMTHNATRQSPHAFLPFIAEIESRGAGEIVINNVDRDGTMTGYDLPLIEACRAQTNLPITVLGGASDRNNIIDLWRTQGIIGAGVGSLFVFKGKYRAVLINYPNAQEKEAMYRTAGWQI